MNIDKNLLKQMIKDRDKQPMLYQLTNYWDYYNISFIKHLMKNGVDFNHRAFHSMGAHPAEYEQRIKRCRDFILYTRKHMNLDKMKTYVELGFGGGTQAQLMRERYDEAVYLLFDVPPFLYVGEHLLKKAFPSDVVSYNITREMKPPFDFKPGKIYIMGNWMFPFIQYVDRVDLFVNSASFQEMEPDVVANYLWFVNQKADNVLLYECMDTVNGVNKADSLERFPGVLDKVCLRDYVLGLSSFDLVDFRVYGYPYSFSFWGRKL